MTRALLVVGLFTALLGVEAVRESWFCPPSDLRVFDAEAVARLDTAMWRSYYERKPLLLFRQLIATLREQYRLPPMVAVLDAYRAAHAAFVFKDGYTRRDYERALPDLESYYRSLSVHAASPFDPQRAARLELEWWILHRERSPRLDSALAALQAEIYRLPSEAFAGHAQLRAGAMLLRDDRGSHITEADWARIGAMLERSWNSLHAAVSART